MEPNQGDYIEQGVRKINRMTIAMGLGPLQVTEIEQILNRATPPTSINGADRKDQPAPTPVESMLQQNMGGML